MLTKCRNNHHLLTPPVPFSPGVNPFYYLFAFLPVFLSAFPPPFRSLHSYIGNAFHKHARKPYPICLTPQRMSEATALPRKLAKEQRRYRESLASSISNISILKSIERWVGGYPLSETKYCSLDHPIEYFRYNIVFILSPTMTLKMRALSYTGFPLCNKILYIGYQWFRGRRQSKEKPAR